MQLDSDYPRVQCLVELSPDGLVRVFGIDSLDVRIVTRPLVQSVQAEIAVDELVELRLPLTWRDLYEPGNVRATGRFEIVTPADLLGREQYKQAWQRLSRCLEKLTTS